MIAVDIETQDPNLHELGDGALRGDGAIIMVGLYDGKDYVCCRPDDPRLPDWLASDEDKIFHNGVYDLSWLCCGYHFKVGGRWHDTMTRCTLINEYAPLDLDSCCKRYKVKGKNYEDTIEAWWNTFKKQYGLRGDVWDNADVISAFPDGWAAMEKYNKQDCVATYNLFMATEPFMKEVAEPYDLETRLYPLWIDLKRRGIRIDIPRLERLQSITENLRKVQEQQLWHEYRIDGETIASPKKLTLAMHAIGVHSPNKTATGNESWDNKSIPLIEHPVATMIMNYKNLDYIAGTKGCGKLLKCCVNGRIHTTFKPNKREEGGAYTGRLGSATPNLQNMPSRDDAYGQKAWGPEIRSVFLPEEGNYMLGAADYGQIEFRLMAHFSVGDHAEWFRDQCRNPSIDMHGLAMERTGIKSRYIIKRINFGVPYGMGIKRMVNLDYPIFLAAAKEHGYNDAWKYGDVLYDQFKTGFPVLFDMMAYIERTIRSQGYMKSIGGRIRRKPPAELNQHGTWSVPYYKMTCVVIQGSQPPTAQILTANGYKQMSALVRGEDKLITECGHVADFRVFSVGMKPRMLFKTQHVQTICSPGHKWAQYQHGRLEYVEANRIPVGTHVYMATPEVQLADILPLQYSHAYLAGYALGDGSINAPQRSMQLLGGADKLHILEALQLRYATADIRMSTGSKGLCYTLSIAARLKVACHLTQQVAHEKRIPTYYFTASLNERVELVRGMWDSDGGVSGSQLVYTSTSKGLIEDLQLLMNSIGIITQYREHDAIYRLFVPSDWREDFMIIVGANKRSIIDYFKRTKKRPSTTQYSVPRELAIDCYNLMRASTAWNTRGGLPKQIRDNIWQVGIYNRCSRASLLRYMAICEQQDTYQYKLLQHGAFTKVVSLEDTGEQCEMFDIEIMGDNDHTYIANGLANHNSAAEILKKGLLDTYEAGIFNTIPMHLTVHDENVVSIPFNKEGTEATLEMINLMQNAYKERLTVPLTSSCEVGPNWGYWESDIWEAMQKGDFNPAYFHNIHAPKVNSKWFVMQNGYQGLDGKVNILDKERMQ